MAQIKSSEIFDPKLFKQQQKDAAELNKTLNVTEQLLKNLTKQSGEALKGFKITDSGSQKKFIDNLQKSKKAVSDLNDFQKERIRIEANLKKANSDRIQVNEKLKVQLQEQRKLNKQLAKEELGLVNAHDKLTSATKKAEKNFKKLAAQHGVNSTQAQKALRQFQKLDNELKEINQTVRKTKKAFGALKAGLAAGAGFIGITAGVNLLKRGISNAIDIFSGFEKANSNLQAILGATDEDMTKLKNSAKELGATTAFTASEVTSLQIEFAKLGFDATQIDNATEATLNLAAAAGVELAEAASVAGATLGGFNLGASETGRITDVMAKSFSTTALDMEKFKESMKSAAPAANAVGISVEKTTALLGTLANAGISGSKAGNNLKTSFINLNAAGLTLEEGLAKVAASQDKLGTATALVGKNAAASFLVLAEGVETTEDIEKGLLGAAGAAERMAKIQLDNLAGDVTILGSAWEGFILSVESGEGPLNRFLRSTVQLATNILGAASGMTDLSNEFFEQEDALNALEDSITPLLDRYDELNTQTELTVEEQKEMDEIILKVAEDVPLAVTAFDDYGNALSISTSAARGFIEEQKNLLLLLNAEAIEEQQEAIEDLGNELSQQRLQLEFVNGEWIQYGISVTRGGGAIKTVTKLTGEQVLAISQERQSIEALIKTRNARIAQLRGEQTEGEKALEAEKAANAVSEEGNEVTKKEIKIVTDLIELKQQEISDRRKVAAVTKEETALKNQEIAVLKEELKILQALGKEKEKQRQAAGIDLIDTTDLERQLDAEEQAIFDSLDARDKAREAQREKEKDEAIELANAITDATVDALREQSDARLDQLDNEISRREESIKDMRARSENEITEGIAFEEAQLEKARLKKQEEEEKAAKRERLIAIAQTFLNQLANSEEEGAAAIAKALAVALGGAVIAETIIGFYEGTEKVEDSLGAPTRSGKDGYDIHVDGKERIMTGNQNQRVGTMSNEELADLAYDYQNGSLENRWAFMPRVAGITAEEKTTKAIIQSNDQVIQAIKDNQTNIEFKAGAMGDEIFTLIKRIKKGQRTVTSNEVYEPLKKIS